jgi:hypothetical protein
MNILGFPAGVECLCTPGKAAKTGQSFAIRKLANQHSN